MKTPHKHAEILRAMADGYEIECSYNNFENFCEFKFADPILDNFQYRIKPEPKPDVVLYGIASINSSSILHFFCPIDQRPDNNLKLTFSTETGKLIKAEVI